MKVVCLVSGLLRSFTEQLFPFLCKCANHIDLHVYVTVSDDSQDTKFHMERNHPSLWILRDHPICKSFNVRCPTFANDLLISQREKNTLYQWYNLYKCFLDASKDGFAPTDCVVRIRPDIVLDCSVEQFVETIRSYATSPGLSIPTGSDIFSKEFLAITNACINDQLAFGPYPYMKEYCTLFNTLNLQELSSPLISESLLFNHLIDCHIPVTRIPIPYHLCLSVCKMVAITGDSGVGKSTFVEAIRECFPFDSQLVLETDRYHKWERGHEQWKTITHLNPDANFLERMGDDTYQLKMGQQIQQVDYDHATGRFTSPSTIESKPFMFLCGLHTLYRRELRAWCDIKVFIDTEEPLKRLWKIQRDMKKRGYSFTRCLDIFTQRQEDYRSFILPQKAHADMMIHYSTPTPLPDVFTTEPVPYELTCTLSIAKPLVLCVNPFLVSVVKESPTTSGYMTSYSLQEGLSAHELIERCDPAYREFLSSLPIRDNFQGIFQIVMILCMIDPPRV